jgi:SAM-dependent methyltransferase
MIVMHPEICRLQRESGWAIPNSPVQNLPDWFSVSSGSVIETAYSDNHVRNRAEIDQHSWWYRTRNKIIIDCLRRESVMSVWDIGSGTGVVAAALKAAGLNVVGVEPSLAGSQLTASMGIPTFHGTLHDLHLPNDSLKAVCLFDVLEHVDNRSALLNEMHRVLQPNGVIVVTVPALPILWSQFDVQEHHHVRFTKASLNRELKSRGFQVTSIGYFYALTVLPLLLLRAVPFRLGIGKSLSDSTAVSKNGGCLGELAQKLEVALAMRTPVGSSILATARKVGPTPT